MPKLILSMDGLVLKEITLTKERTTIGRKPHNDIQIDNLAISGDHAVIVKILDDAFLEDLNSTNGTYVNGQVIRKHVLQDNDVIELGKYRLKYLANAGTSANAGTVQESDEALAFRMDGAVGMPDPVAVAPSVEADGEEAKQPAQQSATQEVVLPPAAVQILSGAYAGRELELTKSLTTLGKPGVQVAVITRRPHGYFITHVEGNTFPVVNGAELGPNAQKLNDHDIIEIAGVKMEFFLRTPS